MISCLFVGIFNKIIHVEFQSCSYYTAFTTHFYITPPLKLHNNRPIKVKAGFPLNARNTMDVTYITHLMQIAKLIQRMDITDAMEWM